MTVTAKGLKQVTFYVDRHKLKTLGQPYSGRGVFAVKIDPRRLAIGAHTVSIKAIPNDPHCVTVETKGLFIDPRPPVVKPRFTG